MYETINLHFQSIHLFFGVPLPAHPILNTVLVKKKSVLHEEQHNRISAGALYVREINDTMHSST